MTHAFDLRIKDWNLAQQIKEHVQIGHCFVFVADSQTVHRSARLGRLLGYQAQSKWSVHALVDAPVELPGVDIIPKHEPVQPLACLVADRDLYRAGQDTAHLCIALPGGGAKSVLRLSVFQDGAPLADRAVELTPDGLAVETLSALLAGRYEAELSNERGPIAPRARFTVAEYTLAPLSGRLASHQLVRATGRLRFELAVESYQVPFDRTLWVTLVDGELAKDPIKIEPTSPGRFSGEVRLDGQGPFRLCLLAAHDPSRVAVVTIPGSREAERSVTVVNELGREVLFSLMPEAGAIPARGGFLTEGDHIATPLTVDEVLVADKGQIHVHAALQALALVVVDHATGTREVVQVGDVEPGRTIGVELRGPLSTVYAGCFIEGHPFEGYTSFIRRSRIAVEVDVPKQARPKEEVQIRVRVATKSPVPCLVAVRDQRLTAVDTPGVALAASSKRVFEAVAKRMEDAFAFRRLAHELLGTDIDDILVLLRRELRREMGLSPMMMPEEDTRAFDELRSAPEETRAFDEELSLRSRSSSVSASANDSWDLRSAPVGTTEGRVCGGYLGTSGYIEGYDEACALEDARHRFGEAEASAPEARTSFPEVLFYGIVPVSGEATVPIALGDSLATYTVEVFALSGGDWSETKATFAVDQPVRADLDIPPAVHAEDQVFGKLRAAAASGSCKVRLTLDGQPVELTCADGRAAAPGSVLRAPVDLTFPVRPGTYVAEVEDAVSGETDRVETIVGTPGRFKTHVRHVALVEKGGRVTLDSENALLLRVLPALDEPFKLLLDATASYQHLCCEQTGAKILASVAMWLSATTEMKRASAADAIMAGIERESRMWKKGRGFSSYPETGDVNTYYSPMVVRYLWTLHPLLEMRDVAVNLRAAAMKGIEMADDVGRALRLSRFPDEIGSVEDACAVATSGNRGRSKDVLVFLEKFVDFASQPVRVQAIPDPVAQRRGLAYAAASYVALGDLSRGIRLANQVTRAFNEAGRLYSTLDSAAAIGLMVQLERAGIMATNGSLRINGRTMTAQDAITATDPIEELVVDEGLAMVEITQIHEEDWTRFSSDLALRIGFRDEHGKPVNRFRPGDRADLLVQLGKGYKFGDLCHVCLPPSMSWIHGGGRVKRFSVDFAGKDEVRVPVAVTGLMRGREHFAVCVRNMFEEARAASPGVLSIEARTG